MYNLDKVIQHASTAANNHASEVQSALSAYVQTPDATTERALRIALVAQAAGHESCAHDGATFGARKRAALDAIAAWDGPEPAHVIVCGFHRLGTNDAEILRVLNYAPAYSNAATREARVLPGGVSGYSRVAEVAQALSEGLRGEAALLRACALARDAKSEGYGGTADQARKLEEQRLHVARVERQTAILNARARGLTASDVDSIVR